MNTVLENQLKSLVLRFSSYTVAKEFSQQIQRANYLFTRDENPKAHFCVYFAVIDPMLRQVFMGHHKKSDHWLFNGGHIDEGETLNQAVAREAMEELGVEFDPSEVGGPGLLTVTHINNPNYECQKHFDIWYFWPVNKLTFYPDYDKLATEFHRSQWFYLEDLLSGGSLEDMVTDEATKKALHRVWQLCDDPIK